MSEARQQQENSPNLFGEKGRPNSSHRASASAEHEVHLQPSRTTFTAVLNLEKDRSPILLIVEDEPDDYILLERALRKAGSHANVYWAKTAFEALKTLQQLVQQAPRVCVVADVQLPGKDGFEMLQQAKGMNASGQIKFAFLTGHHNPVTEKRAYACGADAFYVKPNANHDLVEIARALESLATAPSLEREMH